MTITKERGDLIAEAWDVTGRLDIDDIHNAADEYAEITDDDLTAFAREIRDGVRCVACGKRGVRQGTTCNDCAIANEDVL